MTKKILMLTHEFPPFFGGIGTYSSQLAMAASELGHEITVVAPDFGEDCVNDDRGEYPFEIIRYRGSTYTFKNLPRMMWRTWRLVQQKRGDIIHAVDWPHVLALAFLNRFQEIPFVATVYGTDLLSCLDCRQVKYLGAGDLFSKPQRIFAISEFTKSLCLHKCRDVIPENVLVTTLGVDERWFRTVENPKYALKKYRIPDDHRIILTVARLDERKGHRTVLTALARLSPSLKDHVTYAIIGSGQDESYNGELKELASRSGVNVLFVGQIGDEDLLSFYACASLFCMPGEPHTRKVEGFGLVYLEAAAQGLPSIASRAGAVPEVVLDRQTGILVEPLDVNGTAEAVEKVLSNDGLRESLGGAAREYARQFTWRKCAELTYGR